MKPNNLYYREIAEIVVGDEFPKFYSSMYYMRKIAENRIGTSYEGRKSSNKYLKDWHTAETGNTPETHKFNLWYLRRIAQKYDAWFDMESNENQCLKFISEHISASTTVRLELSQRSVPVGSNVVLTVTVLDEDRQPIPNAEVTLTDGDEYTETGTTDSNGQITDTYTANSVGDIQLTATYDDYTATATLTVRKLESSITIDVDSPVVTVDGTATISGVYFEENIPKSGAVVNIYCDDEYVDDTTTDSNGAYTYQITTDTVGTFTYKAIIDSGETMTGCESSEISIVVNKHSTTLTIDTPTIIYSDDFDVTGTLLKDGSAFSNADVTLTWRDGIGNSGTATETTDSNGKVTFSRSEPTSITQYVFQLKYEGNETISDSKSSKIAVSVGKETAILNITSPTNNQSVSQSETITVTGTLKDNDDEEMTGETVYARIGTTTIGSFTVANDGSITGSISASDLVDGSNSVQFMYDETSRYTSSVQTITINRTNTYTKLDVTASNPILSYADEDKTDISVQLKDNSDNDVEIAGVTLYLKNGSTTIESKQTDATGKVTFTDAYTSQGLGDVTLTVDDGSLVTEIFAIEDCRDYQPLTSNAHESRWTIPSGVTSVYNNTGWKVSTNAYKQVKLTDKLTNACSVEFTVVDYSNTGDMAIIIYAYTNGETTPDQLILTGGSKWSTDWKVLGASLDHDLIKGGKYRIEYTSSTLKVYENDVLLGSATNNVGLPTRFEFHTSSNRWAIYKDLKVKPL